MSGSLVPSPTSSVDLAPEVGSGAVQSWGPPAAPPPAPAPSANLGRYLAAIKRYKWLIAVFVVLGIVGGVVALQFLKPNYRVDTTIVVGETPDPNGPIRAQAILREDAWRELLLSFAILDPVARQTGRYLTPNVEADSLIFRD